MSQSDIVLQALRGRCGAATVDELAIATSQTPLEVIDALYDLERQELAQPVVWRAVREAAV